MFLELSDIEDLNEYCFNATRHGPRTATRSPAGSGSTRATSTITSPSIATATAVTGHQARADRERLGLRHHLPQGAGLAVGERHRLRRRLGRTAEDRARWLYTAITRAERGLVILQ